MMADSTKKTWMICMLERSFFQLSCTAACSCSPRQTREPVPGLVVVHASSYRLPPGAEPRRTVFIQR